MSDDLSLYEPYAGVIAPDVVEAAPGVNAGVDDPEPCGCDVK